MQAIYLNEVDCDSFVNQLVDCDRSSEAPEDEGCVHALDVGINCSNTGESARACNNLVL